MKSNFIWSDIPGPGEFDFLDIYLEAVLNAKDNAHFVEIGSYFGRSVAYLATQVKLHKKRITIDAIDNFTGSDFINPYIWKRFIHKCELTSNINLIEIDQLASSNLYDDESLDFVFIDSDHAYRTTKAVIEAYIPKIKSNGILAGHDYSEQYPGVIRAVNELLIDFKVDKRSFIWTKL